MIKIFIISPVKQFPVEAANVFNLIPCEMRAIVLSIRNRYSVGKMMNKINPANSTELHGVCTLFINYKIKILQLPNTDPK